jgi:hypothetical protein
MDNYFIPRGKFCLDKKMPCDFLHADRGDRLYCAIINKKLKVIQGIKLPYKIESCYEVTS